MLRVVVPPLFPGSETNQLTIQTPRSRRGKNAKENAPGGGRFQRGGKAGLPGPPPVDGIGEMICPRSFRVPRTPAFKMNFFDFLFYSFKF